MNEKEQMNLMIAVNRNYIPVCKTMLFSFFQYHKKRDVSVFILNSTLKNDEVLELVNYIQILGATPTVIEVNGEFFKNMPLSLERFSVEIYFRILAQDLLPKHIDRVLWLDSDMIITGNIEDFYDQNFDNNMLVVCRDFGYQTDLVKKIKLSLDLKSEHDYFNSGVILFDLKTIREKITFDKLYNIMHRYENELIYPDQDLLNNIYQGKVKYANEVEYNYQVNNTYDVDINKLNIKILHYAGDKKPWDVKRARPICKYYWRCQFKMKNYKDYLKFYLLYYILYVPKRIKMIMYSGRKV